VLPNHSITQEILVLTLVLLLGFSTFPFQATTTARAPLEIQSNHAVHHIPASDSNSKLPRDLG
jgi:hypothetical protein